MIIVLKNGFVIATHDDYQKMEITPAKYPHADAIKCVASETVSVGDDDPTLADPDLLKQDFTDIQAAQDWSSTLEIFATITPDEAVSWVENNVTDLASAKQALKYLARAVILLRNRTS